MSIWQIASGETGRDYTSLFLENDIMLLGPSSGGTAIENREEYLDRANSPKRQVLSFCEKIKEGDIILLRFGKRIIKIGIIPREESTNTTSRLNVSMDGI